MNKLPTEYQNFIALSRYARWLEKENRRETWNETVKRYFDFFDGHIKTKHAKALKQYRKTRPELEAAVLNLEVLPSMRCLMTAGPALERDNVAGYNCSYLPIDSPRAFDESMYILLCGTGVGFSVENRYVEKLPQVAPRNGLGHKNIIVEDSKIGWASALRELISNLYAGHTSKWDLSKIRPAGARLKTFGGRASGPAPLNELFHFVTETFTKAQGRKLTSLEAHDIVCKIGDVVVVGGVRRSALISLSDLNDDLMRNAKKGEWYKEHPHRALANNSAVYDGSVPFEVFFKEWYSLYESRSGERGIFNRSASRTQVSRTGRRNPDYEWGTNPCSEIILRPNQFCNLSEVVVRSGDSKSTLMRKVKLATILGSLQATLTNFRYLRKSWETNTKDERLLGVSLTGILDNGYLGGVGDLGSGLNKTLNDLRNESIETNLRWSKYLGIPQSKAVTCVKPSGTVSQLVDSSSGIHPRHSAYYVRTVRADVKDPLAQFMASKGFPNEPAIGKEGSTVVFSFPQKAPHNAILREDLGAVKHLELWKKYQDHWCEHKPSVTATVKENEWLEVGNWVFNNLGAISGVSFLPHSEHIYAQAPYQEVDEDTYKALVEKMPKNVNWDELALFEKEDSTIGSQELACTAGTCELL